MDLGDIGGVFFMGGDMMSGIQRAAQALEMETWARNKADELLNRPGDATGPCRFCGTEEDICSCCGCCPNDHVLLMAENLLSPEDVRMYGFTRYIQAINGNDLEGVSIASSYITDCDRVFEMMREAAKERRKQIEGEVEDLNLDNDVWAEELDNLDFSDLG